MRTRVLPSARALALLAGVAALMVLAPAVALVADLLVLALIAFDAWASARSARPAVTLDLPPQLPQGQPATARLVVRNPGPRPLVLRFVLDVPDVLAGAGAIDVRAFELAAGDVTELPVELMPRRRGRFEAWPLHRRVLGRLGLAWWQTTSALPARVDVVPGLQEVRSYRLLAERHQLRRAGLRSVRERGEGTAFESLREWVRGDDARHVDWKASARHRKLIVRQHEAERSQSLMLCVDTGRLMAEPVGTGDRLDHALAAAVVLAEVARAWNDEVGLLAFSDRIDVLLPPGRHAARRLPALCAGLDARGVEPDYPRALGQLARMLHRRTLIVVFGDAIDREVSGPLAAHLGLLAHRHLPLFVALRNPQLLAAAGARVHDTAAAYHRAAAAELVQARARTLHALRATGVLVADVPPAAAVATVVNRYLEIKQRATL